GRVIGDLDAAPLAAQHAVAVDQKGAAIDPHAGLAVELLLPDHVEQFAHGFFGVRQQGKRQLVLCLEVFVRADAVARYAQDFASARAKLVVQIAKILPLAGTAGGVILGVEINNDLAPAQAGETDVVSA